MGNKYINIYIRDAASPVNLPFKLIPAYILLQFNNRALKVIIVELIGFVLLLIALASTL